MLLQVHSSMLDIPIPNKGFLHIFLIVLLGNGSFYVLLLKITHKFAQLH
jgi:hypothetical protein